MIRIIGRSVSILGLVITNIIPLFGVLYWGWDLFSLMLLYWSETMIVGTIGAVKIAKISDKGWRDEAVSNLLGYVFLGGGVYLAFITLIFSGFIESNIDENVTRTEYTQFFAHVGATFAGIALPAGLAFLSHGLSYFVNFLGRGEYRRLQVEDIPKVVGWRMIATHLAILGGCYYAFEGDDPTRMALLILTGAKIVGDLILHFEERQRETHVVNPAETASF